MKLSQQLLLLALGDLVFALPALAVLQPLPQLQVAEKLRAFVVELLVRGIGGLRVFDRPVAHVLHAEGAGDDQDFGQRLAVARFEDHAADTRVERQTRQLAADRREFVEIVDRAEFGEQLVTVGDGAFRWWFQERKVLDRAEVQRLHPQDHAGQRRTHDFRVAELRALAEILLVVQADADAVADTPAAPGTLVRRGLADRLDQQLLDLVAVAVALDARGAGVDDELDARHGQRGLGHVGGQHDAARGVRLEHTVLFLLAQAGEQRHHFDPRRVVLAQVVGGFADLALAGQEHEHVAAAFTPEFVHRVGDRVVQIVFAALFERPPALFDREQTPRDHDHRRRPRR